MMKKLIKIFWKSGSWYFLAFILLLLFGFTINVVQADNTMERTPVFYVDFEDGTTQDTISGSPASTGMVDIVSNWSGGYVAQFARLAGRSLQYDISANVNDVLNNVNSWGFTVAMRVMYTNLAPINNNNYEVLMARRKWSNNAQWFIGGRSGSRINIFTSSAGAATVLDKSITFSQPTPWVWYTLIFSYDGTQYTTYNNGVFVSSGSETLKPSTDSTLEFGRIVSETAATRWFNGAIDSIGIRSWVAVGEDIAYLIETLGTGDSVVAGPIYHDVENQSFITSDGLEIFYNVYYNSALSGPIVITSDTWNGVVAPYWTEMKGMRNNFDFIGATMTTRGKGSSQGDAQAFGYDCKDIYELANHLKTLLSGYYDPAQWVHLMGASGGGGRALVCAGRYPDFFTSVYAAASVSSLTRWYTIETNPQINSDRDTMRRRTWINVGAEYHPIGFPSVNGSVENQEAYDARDGGLIGAYNTLASVYLSHGDADPRVDISLDQAYDTIWHNSNKTNDYEFYTCVWEGHNWCNYASGSQWVNNHKWILTLPTSWDFRIGGRVETKKFKIEFLKDVGYMGTVNYQLKDNDQFKFIVKPATYTGETEVLVKDVDENLDIKDNGVVIGNLSGGVVSNVASSYSITYNGTTKELDIILQTLSSTGNIIEGITPTMTNPSNPTNPTSPSWWGGGNSASKDNCPNGDFSQSYYDGECGSRMSENWEPENVGEWKQDSNSLEFSGDNSPTFSNEILSAYQFAYSHNITTLAPLASADPQGTVIRGHLAKMVVNYALNVLWKTLPAKVPASCHRKDGANAWESSEIKDFAVKACQLGLMGMDMDYFQPYAVVSRAQFGTILSRLLFGNTYAGGKVYYSNHLQALKEKGILTQIDNPEARLELRQWVRLMLMRSAK